MNSLVIIASALFFNASNPADQVPAVSVATDLVECAQMLNDARTGVETELGVYYPTKSRCTVVEVDATGTPVGVFDENSLFE